MANNTLYGLAASVHSEQLTLALETAKHVKAGTVWINCHNMFDAAAGFGGYRQSGYGRDGGQEGLWEYIKPKWQKSWTKTVVGSGGIDVDMAKFGKDYDAGRPAINGNGVNPNRLPSVDRTYKLYYGGAQKRPDGNYVGIIRDVEGNPIAQVGQSNRKDVRNAVEAALKAQPCEFVFFYSVRDFTSFFSISLGEKVRIQSSPDPVLHRRELGAEEERVRGEVVAVDRRVQDCRGGRGRQIGNTEKNP